jgi:hypothetical protein
MSLAAPRLRAPSTRKKSLLSREDHRKGARRRHLRLPSPKRPHLQLLLSNRSSCRSLQLSRHHHLLPPVVRMSIAGLRIPAHRGTCPPNRQEQMLRYQSQAPLDLQSTEFANPSGHRMRPHRPMTARGMLLVGVLARHGSVQRMVHQMLRFKSVMKQLFKHCQRALELFENHHRCARWMILPVTESRHWSP